MKKYKLIKEYPGCQLFKCKVGDIVTQFEFSGSKWYNKYGDHRELCLLQSSVEDYPEFWEEVKEDEWEILSFYYPEFDKISRRISSGRYLYEVYEEKDLPFKGVNGDGMGAKLEEMLKFKCNINSVKRLSDGEIFTVGDKIEHGSISKFVFTNDDLHIFVKPNDNRPAIFEVDLGSLKKLKPLFTTEDGVDIFYGDECWYVLNRNSFVGGNYIKQKRKCNGRAQEGKCFFYEENADAYLKQGRKILYGVDSEFKRTREEIEERVNKAFWARDWKWFNSEKEREIYIEENQPRFSMKDVMDFGKYVGKCLDFTNPLKMFYDWVNQPKNK